MKVLNLYCGIGGNRKHWKNCQVTAVEINKDIADAYKLLYPQDEVIVADAHEYLLNNYEKFDFIWSSPPCPTHSKLRLSHKNKPYPDMKLYQEIIFLNHFFKGVWVVENVDPYYEPLIKPEIKIGRHLFWSNFTITNFIPKKSSIDVSRDNKENLAIQKDLKEVLQIDVKQKRLILRNAVDAQIGKHIFWHINPFS